MVHWCLLTARRLGPGGDFPLPLLKGQVTPGDGAFEKSLCRLACQWLTGLEDDGSVAVLMLMFRTCMETMQIQLLTSLLPLFFHQHTHSQGKFRNSDSLWCGLNLQLSINVSKQSWIQISWNRICFFPKPFTSHQCPALSAIKPGGPLVLAVPSAPALWAHTEQHHGFQYTT